MRYMGNKCKLLNEIDKLLMEKNLKVKGLTFCDAFSGTATVANFYNGFFKLIANDFLSFSYHYTAGLLLHKKTSFKSLGFNPFEYFAHANTFSYTNGFCYNNFSPNGGCQYFSDENAKKIDFIRDSIDKWSLDCKITSEEKSYLIACLLESISRISNVAGVYSAFLKIWDPRALKPMEFLPLKTTSSRFKNRVFCEDVSELIKHVKGDILYLDPPYTPTQYNSQYHVLETIARNDNPKTHGIGRHRENDRLSNWCKKGAVEFEFEKLIKEAKFKHIVFSYSDKGIMSPSFIKAVLKRYGKPETFVFKRINFVKYKNTRAVNKENAEQTHQTPHYEYLFYIEKKDIPKYISPLNYIGGKFESLDLITQNFPKKIRTFYDLFGGGATVALNAPCKKVVYNEINTYVVDLLKFLSNEHPVLLYDKICKLQKRFELIKGNKEGYIALRTEYNRTHAPLLLYLLICYGFEHQIRFNSKHEFNNPCGNSGFNDEMYEKLISFYLRCKDLKIEFINDTYINIIDSINKNDFVYLDPPYLGNNGAYQDGKRGFNGWDDNQEQELHGSIEQLSRKGIRFMLSNYIEHSTGNENPLEHWCCNNKFNQISNEQMTKRNRQSRREIIITNYREDESFADKS